MKRHMCIVWHCQFLTFFLTDITHTYASFHFDSTSQNITSVCGVHIIITIITSNKVRTEIWGIFILLFSSLPFSHVQFSISHGYRVHDHHHYLSTHLSTYVCIYVHTCYVFHLLSICFCPATASDRYFFSYGTQDM